MTEMATVVLVEKFQVGHMEISTGIVGGWDYLGSAWLPLGGSNGHDTVWDFDHDDPTQVASSGLLLLGFMALELSRWTPKDRNWSSTFQEPPWRGEVDLDALHRLTVGLTDAGLVKWSVLRSQEDRGLMPVLPNYVNVGGGEILGTLDERILKLLVRELSGISLGFVDISPETFVTKKVRETFVNWGFEVSHFERKGS